MADNDFVDAFAKKRPVPILTHENSERWFNMMERFLTSEDLFQWIDTETAGTPSSTPGGVGSQKPVAKAIYWIMMCLDEDDQESVMFDKDVTSVWTKLKDKYKVKLETTNRQIMQDYMTFIKPADKLIRETWIDISRLARKVVAHQPKLEHLQSKEYRFQILLRSLPEEYAVIVDAIDGKGDQDIDVSMQKLEEKEAQLQRLNETGMWAKGSSSRHPSGSRLKSYGSRPLLQPSDSRPSLRGNSKSSSSLRRKSSSSSGSPPRRARFQSPSPKCYLCDGEHLMKDCEMKKAFKAFSKMMAETKTKGKGKEKTKPKKHRAYKAEDKLSGQEADSESNNDAEDEEAEETATLSKEIAGKHPNTHWIADPGASSPMTDQHLLFSGPLTKIKRRTVKVGGGKLYSDYMGTAIMQAPDGNKRSLPQTLLVPGLGVNLLSGSRLCKEGLHGSFNTDGLYMRDRNGKVWITAKQQGGVYIVSKITPSSDVIDGSALISTTYLPPSLLSSDSDQHKHYQDLTSAFLASDALTPANQNQASEKDLYKLWHRRFGHLGPAKLRNLHQVTTLKKPIPIAEDHSEVCQVCALTKIVNKRDHHVSERKSSILALISIDVCGPLPPSRLGFTYFLYIIDNYSRRSWVRPMKNRTDCVEALDKWKRITELQCGTRLKAVRSDNAPELKKYLDTWCASFGVAPQYTEPYQSIQNGVAERGIRTVENQVRAMIKESGLPIEFWPEAAEADAYLRNRIGTGPIVNGSPTTPMEAFTGVKPSIDHIRVWGCKCYSYIDPKSFPAESRKDKFMDRGRECVFLGYVDDTESQVLLWAPDLRRVIKAHGVKFAEHEKGGSIPNLNLPKVTPNVLPERKPVGRPRKEVFSQEPHLNPDGCLSRQGPEQASQPADPKVVDKVTPPTPKVIETQVAPPPAPQSFLRVEIPKRKRAEESESDREEDNHRNKISRANLALMALDIDDLDHEDDVDAALAYFGADSKPPQAPIREPATYEQAINDPEWGHLWKDAIRAEITALMANGTWKEIVPPKGSNIVTSKWVFKVKMNMDGTLDKLKARLVARGFSQVQGIDYQDTFAPTVKFDTLRLFLALVALEDLECHQVDVNNAFTESMLKEDIYMSPPPGLDLAPGRKLHILRSLYGLKQAARDWHERCVKELAKLGFRQCPADPCLLLNSDRGILLLVYVDDIGIATRSLNDVYWFKKEFAKIFKIKDLGEMKKILGIKITRVRKNRSLRMDQSHYLEEVLDRLNMRPDKHSPTELPLNGYDCLRPAGHNDERIDQRYYQQAIGSIMYAAIHTRPDIAFTIGRLSQYLSDPAKHHGRALKGLLRYIRSTIDRGIEYKPSGSHNASGSCPPGQIAAYSDSDYAADRLERKSILGYVYMLGGGPISWMSRKQKSVATSTTEAEYMALSTCAKEGLWISQLLRDIGMTQYLGGGIGKVGILQNEAHEAASPVQLKGDNQASLTLVKDAHIHERSKHIDVAYHHIRDLYKKNLIHLGYVPSQDMVADGMTKPLPKDKFKRFIELIGLKDSGSH